MSDDATKKVEIESVPYDMGNIAPTLRDDDELLDMGEEFNFDDFQVVRREFLRISTSLPCHLTTASSMSIRLALQGSPTRAMRKCL